MRDNTMEYVTGRWNNVWGGEDNYCEQIFGVYPDDPEDVYWNGGPTHCGRSGLKEFTVVKSWGVPITVEDFEYIWKTFAQEHPPEPFDFSTNTKDNIHGWLAPSGIFYACAYGEHSHKAHSICDTFYYGNGHNSENYLYKIGYISLNNGYLRSGRINDESKVITTEQIETMKKIVALSKPTIAETIIECLDYMFEVDLSHN